VPDTIKEKEAELDVRRQLASGALAFIDEDVNGRELDHRVLARLKNKYEVQLKLSSIKASGALQKGGTKQMLSQYVSLQQELLDYERSLLLQMHKEGSVASEILKTLEHELDIEETRLNEQMKRVK
jgi:CPA1 family monovalent cation:H+ antiporter